MAQANNNPLLQKISGTLGRTLTFKQYNGKTYITKTPEPSKTESPDQKRVRDRFRTATQMAKELLLDPEHKAYYTAEAKKRKQPNAYTAANQDALLTIKAYLQEEELPQPSACEMFPDTVNTEEAKATNVTGNGEANIIDELLGYGDPSKAPAGNASGLDQQLADATTALQHCLLELQRVTAKVGELMKAVETLNAQVTDSRATASSDAKPADSEVPTLTDTKVTDSKATASPDAMVTNSKGPASPDAKMTDSIATTSPDTKATDSQATTSPHPAVRTREQPSELYATILTQPIILTQPATASLTPVPTPLEVYSTA